MYYNLFRKSRNEFLAMKGAMIMKYYVNENCIGCGLCNGICPEVFTMTDKGTAEVAMQEIPAELEVSAQEAMDSCPAQAIEHS